MSNGEQYDRYIDGLRRLLSESYSQAKSYSNLIVVAGYASYFAAINYCKEYLPTNFFLWSIVLMILSIILFVSLEIYSMISTTINLRGFQDALSDRENFYENLESYNRVAQRQKIRIGRIWSYHLYPTLIFAAASLILFLSPLACKLF